MVRDGACAIGYSAHSEAFDTIRNMSVAKVTEISSTSEKSFEDAIHKGLTRAGQTIRNIRGAWIKEQHVRVNDGKVSEYQVNMMITFVLDDAAPVKGA